MQIPAILPVTSKQEAFMLRSLFIRHVPDNVAVRLEQLLSA